jgi:hypothetical protein
MSDERGSKWVREDVMWLTSCEQNIAEVTQSRGWVDRHKWKTGLEFWGTLMFITAISLRFHLMIICCNVSFEQNIRPRDAFVLSWRLPRAAHLRLYLIATAMSAAPVSTRTSYQSLVDP